MNMMLPLLLLDQAGTSKDNLLLALAMITSGPF